MLDDVTLYDYLWGQFWILAKSVSDGYMDTLNVIKKIVQVGNSWKWRTHKKNCKMVFVDSLVQIH